MVTPHNPQQTRVNPEMLALYDRYVPPGASIVVQDLRPSSKSDSPLTHKFPTSREIRTANQRIEKARRRGRYSLYSHPTA